MLFWIMVIFIVILFPLQFKNKILLIIPFVFLSVISGFRYGIGPDYFQYVHIYNDIITGVGSSKEVGYKFLSFAVHILGGNAQSLFLLFSIITSLCFYKFIKYTAAYVDVNVRYEYSYLMLILFLSFYFFQSMNQVRQFAAISISIYGLMCLFNRRYIHFLCLIVFASSIHLTALFILLIAPFLFLRISNVIIIVTLFLICFIDPIDWVASLYIELQLPYYGYLSYAEFSNATSISGMISTYISSGIILYFVLRFSSTNERFCYFVKNLLVIYLVFRLLALDFEQINRIANYFKPFLFVVFSSYLLAVRKSIVSIKEKFIFAIVILLFSINMIYIYRSYIDDTYAHYTLNYCIYSASKCPILVSENLWK